MPCDLSALLARLDALNGPDVPFQVVVDGDVVRGSWKLDDPEWATRLRDDRAPLRFTYLITLRPDDHSYQWAEQDAGYRNGTVVAYKGYRRGINVNLLTLIVSAVRRRQDRRRVTEHPTTPRHRDDIKGPINAALAESGWKSRGIGW